jgi:hypothetical protein
MAEEISVQLMQQLVTLNPDEIIVPLRVRREDVHRLKAVKLSDEEVTRVDNLQDYLFDRGYLADNTFASLFVYLFNLGYTMHKKIADEEAAKEEKKP